MDAVGAGLLLEAVGSVCVGLGEAGRKTAAGGFVEILAVQGDGYACYRQAVAAGDDAGDEGIGV